MSGQHRRRFRPPSRTGRPPIGSPRHHHRSSSYNDRPSSPLRTRRRLLDGLDLDDQLGIVDLMCSSVSQSLRPPALDSTSTAKRPEAAGSFKAPSAPYKNHLSFVQRVEPTTTANYTEDITA